MDSTTSIPGRLTRQVRSGLHLHPHGPGTVQPFSGADGADAGSVLDPRVAALLPHQLLDPGEIIILLLRPSPWTIVTDTLAGLGILAITAALLSLLAPALGLGHLQGDILFTAGALAGLRLLWQLFDWLSRVYILTDRRVLVASGVFRVIVNEAPLGQVQTAELTATDRERWLALGSIEFTIRPATAPTILWRSLARPAHVHELVLQALHRYR